MFLDGENDGSRVLVGDQDGNMLIVDLKMETFTYVPGYCFKVSINNYSLFNSISG